MKPTIAPMSALLRPSDAWAPRLRVLLPRGQSVSFLRVLNATDAMDKLAVTLQTAIETSTSADGRCDFKNVAFEVLVEIVRCQRTVLALQAPAIPITDSMIAIVADHIERAIEKTQKRGVVDMKDLATRVYADVTGRTS